MNQATAVSRGADAAPVRPGPATRARSGTPALVLLASLIVSLLASSSAPTPLYAVYQASWGFSPITTTVVFGVYALSVLATLLTFGKISDHIGRRPVLLTTLVVQIAAMVVFATADGVPALLVARVVQGLATGAALGAIGAAMLDVDARRGTFANAVAPGIGTATGALVSALAVRYLPAPTHLIYLVLLVVFAVQTIGVALMRETVTRVPGALASLRPEIKLPHTVRGPVLAAFFKVSCPTCQYAFPFLERIYKANGNKNVTIVGISQNEKKDTAAFMKEYGMTFPVLLDDTKTFPVSNAYGLTNVPSIFWIAEDGEIEISSVGWDRQEIEVMSRKAAESAGDRSKSIFQPGENVADFRAG